jgi:hypothetical protein
MTTIGVIVKEADGSVGSLATAQSRRQIPPVLTLPGCPGQRLASG